MNKDDMSLSARAAYIKGLAEGQELEPDKKAGRVIQEMLDLLVEMAGDVEDIGADLTELYEVVDEIDENLSFVEEEVYGDMEGGCGCGHGDEMYEVPCPYCGESVHADEELILSGDLICPACGKKIEVEIDGCDCGFDHED